MNNISIQLIINPQCKLVAVDRTNYLSLFNGGDDAILNHVSLEFLVYKYDETPLSSTIIFKEYCHRRSEYGMGTSVISLPKDGIFTYYKFIIPKLEHLVKIETNAIKIQDQTFYYKNQFYKGLEDIHITEETVEDAIKLHEGEILSKSEIVENYLDIWNSIKSGNSTQTFSFQQILFSMCKLQECLVNLQKSTLLDSRNCLECETNTSIKYKRDFLFSALYVLDYLKDRDNYDEAQRILDNLSACGNLCGDELELNNNCGCGSTK